MKNCQCNTKTQMSTLLLAAIGAFVALLLIAIGPGQARGPLAEASNSVEVSPPEGNPSKVFSVSLTADKAVTGNNWYLVEIKARSKKRSCEYYESVQVSNATSGQRVGVELRPYDRRRWCVGRYSGTVRHQKRISCRAPDIEKNFCSDAGSVTARFDLRVTR